METRTKFLATVLVVAVIAFVLAPDTPIGAAVWPELASDETPTGLQVPLFMLLGVLDALFLGFAAAFLAFGWRYTRAVFDTTPRLAPFVHLGIVWIPGNFWVHNILHRVNGEALWGLLALEYVFHVTVMFAGLGIAYAVVSRVRAADTDGSSGSTSPGPVAEAESAA